MLYTAALTIVFALIIGARASRIWIEVAHDSHMLVHAVEHGIVLTAIAVFLVFEAFLLARRRLSEHSVERLVFHITVLGLTMIATALELSALKADLMAEYLNSHALPLGVEASVGARSFTHVLSGMVNVLVRMMPVAAVVLRPAVLVLVLVMLNVLATRSCAHADMTTEVGLPSMPKVAVPDRAASAPTP
jgi:hypothetical protein